MIVEVSTITDRKRSLTSDGLIRRCRLWLRLIGLVDDLKTREIAEALSEDLDSAYTELTLQAYTDGVEDGRAIGAVNADDTIGALR